MQDRRRLLLRNCATFFALAACAFFFASCDTWEDWVPKFIVTFNTNGGGGTVPAPQSVDARSPVPITLPNGNYLSKSGFIFGGWNTNAAGTGTNHEEGTTFKPTENITLFARWAVAFTVTFDANGGSGTPPVPQTVVAGSAITLPGGYGLSRTGFILAGWNTNADGTGVDHGIGTTFIPTGNKTLFARWVVAFTVTFDANGGSGTPPAPWTVAAGSTITLPGSYGLSRNGFIFGGWNTNADGTGTNHNAGTMFTPAGDITLFARWVVAFTITFADLRNMAPEIQLSQPIFLRDGGTANFVVDNPSQYASIRWFHGVRELTSADGVSADRATFTVGLGIHGNWLGTHRIMLQVEVARGGDLVPYSSVIAFEIRP